MEKLLVRGTTKLYTASDSKNEYKAMMRTLTGENKTSTLDSEMVNDTLLAQACKTVSHATEIHVILKTTQNFKITILAAFSCFLDLKITSRNDFYLIILPIPIVLVCFHAINTKFY